VTRASKRRRHGHFRSLDEAKRNPGGLASGATVPGLRCAPPGLRLLTAACQSRNCSPAGDINFAHSLSDQARARGAIRFALAPYVLIRACASDRGEIIDEWPSTGAL
jgi:hypothetical protein